MDIIPHCFHLTCVRMMCYSLRQWTFLEYVGKGIAMHRLSYRHNRSLSIVKKILMSENTVPRFTRVLILVVTIVAAPLSSFSQGSQGTIQGSVVDSSGGAIVGAKVTVTDVARGVARNLTTDDAGQYVAPALTAGTYTVRAEAS